MSQELKYITNITPETKKWTVKVRVMEKSSPRAALQSSHKYQRLILVDAQGTRVQATIFGNDIDTLANTLYILGHYYISNAIVKQIEEQHRVVNNEYQWTISTKTPISEVPEDDLNGRLIATPFNLVPFSDLPKHLYSRIPVGKPVNTFFRRLSKLTLRENSPTIKLSSFKIDILGVVVDIYPKKTVKINSTLQEILLVNHEMKPTIMTLWDDFISNKGAYITQYLDSHPIIVATRLKISSFNGISLSTKASSTFLLNPPIPESHALQQWISQNTKYIKTLLKDRDNVPTFTAPTSSATTTTTVIPISALSTTDKNVYFWVKASASIKTQTRKLWYMCCDTCWNGIHADYNQKFKCRPCGSQERTAKPRCCFPIELSDESGCITVMIFGEHAEKVFNINAVKMMEMETNAKVEQVKDGEEQVKNKESASNSPKVTQNTPTNSPEVTEITPTTATTTEYYFQLKLSKKHEEQFSVNSVAENPP